jgi:predicted RNA-binding Zn-ribbon protein involved in translation (DUF1610 family)
MSARYQCGACGWDGDMPAFSDEPLSRELLWTLRTCPECGEEVYQVVILKEERFPPSKYDS